MRYDSRTEFVCPAHVGSTLRSLFYCTAVGAVELTGQRSKLVLTYGGRGVQAVEEIDSEATSTALGAEMGKRRGTLLPEGSESYRVVMRNAQVRIIRAEAGCMIGGGASRDANNRE